MSKIINFTKMNGIGNDYIYINCIEQEIDNPSEIAKRLSDRHFAIGSDGLVLIKKSSKADFYMSMFNADGSEAEMCGNAIRCVAKYVFDNGLTTKNPITVETLSGTKTLDLDIRNNKVESVTVDMGEPELNPHNIPVNSTLDKFINQSINVLGKEYKFSCVSMGNPHAVTFMQNLDNLNISEIGPQVENLIELFPKKTNVEFVEVQDKNNLKMRVWERGSNETLACGTGACAVLVASYLNGLSSRKATVHLLGGSLNIEWNEDNNHVYLTGGATKSFDGQIEI